VGTGDCISLAVVDTEECDFFRISCEVFLKVLKDVRIKYDLAVAGYVAATGLNDPSWISVNQW
jgi:hypothetical protein